MKKILFTSVIVGIALIISGGVDVVKSESVTEDEVYVTDCFNELNNSVIKEMFNEYNTYKEQEESMQEIDKEVENTLPIMPNYDIILAKEYQQYIWDKCMEDSWGYELIIALIYKENSTFDIHAVSASGHDKGLTQCNDNWYEWHKELLGKDFDYFNPYDNIDLCFAILNFYRTQWINKVLNEDLLYYTCNSYNMGLEGFKNYLNKYGTKERNYTDSIFKYKQELEMNGTIVEE